MRAFVRRTVFQLVGAAVSFAVVTPVVAQLPSPPPAVPRAKPDAPSPLEPIAWLAGSWAAEAKAPGSNRSSKILTRFTPELDGRVMLMETSFDGEPVYAGMFGYDPAQKAIGFWYVTPHGESIKGTVAPKGSDQLFDFRMTLTNGLDLHFQTTVHRVDADHYAWALFTTLNKGATWDKMFEVQYHRVP
jgi:hypothetical protein